MPPVTTGCLNPEVKKSSFYIPVKTPMLQSGGQMFTPEPGRINHTHFGKEKNYLGAYLKIYLFGPALRDSHFLGDL